MKKTPEQIEFEQIYKQYSGRIYSFAMVISKGDTYLSEEILQTTFTKLWEHWGNLKSQDRVLSYLFTTAKNTFVNYCDHEMVKRVYADYLQSQEEEVDNMQEEGQDAKFLEEYIKDLVMQMPPQRQRVFVLSRFKHKTNKEIAQILNVSEKTVEVHITLALKQLREKIKRLTNLNNLYGNMVSMKKLAEKYLQGNLSNMEKEHLLYLIKNDQNVDEWLRTSIEMADEVMPDVVRDRVINNVFRSNTTAPAIRSRMPIWKRVMMICSVMVAMCVGAAVYHYTFRVDHMTGMFEVATNIGERSNVTLPDGTHVVLNAKTKLQYNYSTIDGKRKVFLQGEAFFDVEEDTDHPFIVYANDVEVECLGTSFNVRNHEEEQTVSVVLVEGKVRVQAGAAELLMEPDNRMVFDKHSLALSKHRVDSDNYLCWLNNEVRYNNQTLEEIAGELARNYNIRIVITSDELKKERFTGYLGQSSLRNVLEVLSMTSGIRYYYDTDTVYLHKRI